MSRQQLKRTAIWTYSGGYYAYLTATIYAAWHILGWSSIMGMYASTNPSSRSAGPFGS
jgi:hypothetical protein